MQSLVHDISEFLSLLQNRQALLRPGDTATDRETGSSLNYANALLRHQAQRLGDCTLPPQVMVIGPTQSGKSTAVNLLLGSNMAEASPLAGYTQYAQGFSVGELGEGAVSCLERMLINWSRVEADTDQEVARNAVYSFTQIGDKVPFTDVPVIVWDTPDFDSVSSREYRETVPGICALADVIVLVVCREKYADRSVWQMLGLVSAMEIPLFVCLNKVHVGEQATLLAALQQRMDEAGISCSGMAALPYIPAGEGRLEDTGEASALVERIAALVPRSPAPRSARLIYDFLARHWESWTAAVQLEISATEQWDAVVRAELEDALSLYQRDYLDNPRSSDTLQRAIYQLLQLLEIPGIAPAVARVRSVLTWPVRKLRDVLGSRWSPGGGAGKGEPEGEILEEAIAHLSVNLRSRLNRQLPASTGGPSYLWWQGVIALYDQQEPEIRAAAAVAVKEYQEDFEAEIEAAGRRLYQHLRQHPATLNSLRAARATTDVAAVVLAVKTGGIGVNDLILTPAMLSITSLLAEGAVGQYMKQIGKELREKQLEQVRERIFERILRSRLLELPNQLSANQCLHIPRELVERAASALPKLRVMPREVING